MQELAGKVAVVTGGGSGMGRAMCHLWAEEGMRVVVADIESTAAEAVAAECRERGADAIAVPCDVSKGASVQGLAEAAFAEFGAVHLLCNNAGVVLFRELAACTEQDWNWVMGVNVMGIAHAISAFVPRMRAQGEPAHIVNTASLAGIVPAGGGPLAGLGAYTASKYAVVGLSESLRGELLRDGIGVSVLCPGGVATRIRESGRVRPAEFGGPMTETEAPTPPAEATAGTYGRMDPAAVAAMVRDAVKADRFYVITHRSYEPGVRKRFERILDAFQWAQ